VSHRVLEEHGDNPPWAWFCEPHKQRMWWLRTDDHPTRGYYSDPGKPESVYENAFLNFSDSETVGDIITGAVGNYEGLLVVFTEKAVWTVSGTGAVIGDITDWSKVRTNAQIGSVASQSAVRIPAGSKYSDQLGQLQTTQVSTIAYFTPLGDVRLFDGNNDVVISHPMRNTLREFAYTERKKVHALLDHENEQVIWFFPAGNNGECTQACCWNYRYGVWYEWPDMPISAAGIVDTETDAEMLLGGESQITKGAFIYKFFDPSLTSFDGDEISSRWMTKTIYGLDQEGLQAISHKKRWRWADWLFRVNQGIEIVVEWLTGESEDEAAPLYSIVIDPSAGTLVTSNGSTILTADGSSILLSRQTAQIKTLLHNPEGVYMYDEGIRLRIGATGTDGGWALEGMRLAYQLLPGLKRRDQD